MDTPIELSDDLRFAYEVVLQIWRVHRHPMCDALLAATLSSTVPGAGGRVKAVESLCDTGAAADCAGAGGGVPAQAESAASRAADRNRGARCARRLEAFIPD